MVLGNIALGGGSVSGANISISGSGNLPAMLFRLKTLKPGSQEAAIVSGMLQKPSMQESQEAAT